MAQAGFRVWGVISGRIPRGFDETHANMRSAFGTIDRPTGVIGLMRGIVYANHSGTPTHIDRPVMKTVLVGTETTLLIEMPGFRRRTCTPTSTSAHGRATEVAALWRCGVEVSLESHVARRCSAGTFNIATATLFTCDNDRVLSNFSALTSPSPHTTRNKGPETICHHDRKHNKQRCEAASAGRTRRARRGL